MTDLALLTGALANNPLFQELQGVNDKLSGGSGGMQYRRISIKGGKFRQMVSGEQVAVSKEDNMNIVVIDAAPIARTYYASAYDPTAEAVGPKCWSSDTKIPDASIAEEDRQSTQCATCPMAIKGSGNGESRACRFSQRLAVVLEGQLEDVYQLQLPATSVFGKTVDGKMPMQAYGKYLNTHKAPAIALYSNMYFDENSDAPKLFFKAAKPLTEQELEVVAALRDTDEVKNALDMNVAQTDGVQKKAESAPENAPPPPPATKAVPVTKAKPEPEPDEPVKVAPKRASASEPAPDDLGGIIDEWDDA